jgi:hypothetical protein
VKRLRHTSTARSPRRFWMLTAGRGWTQVKLLLQSGANPSIPDFKRRTPVHVAHYRKSQPVQVRLGVHGSTRGKSDASRLAWRETRHTADSGQAIDTNQRSRPRHEVAPLLCKDLPGFYATRLPVKKGFEKLSTVR